MKTPLAGTRTILVLIADECHERRAPAAPERRVTAVCYDPAACDEPNIVPVVETAKPMDDAPCNRTMRRRNRHPLVRVP